MCSRCVLNAVCMPSAYLLHAFSMASSFLLRAFYMLSAYCLYAFCISVCLYVCLFVCLTVCMSRQHPHITNLLVLGPSSDPTQQDTIKLTPTAICKQLPDVQGQSSTRCNAWVRMSQYGHLDKQHRKTLHSPEGNKNTI